MKIKELLIVLLALVVGIALGWLIANSQQNYASGAIVSTPVFNANNASIIGEINAEAGTCKFLNNGNLICPGAPNANVQECLTGAKKVCNDDTCLLEMTQACIDVLETEGVDLQSPPSPAKCCQIKYKNGTSCLRHPVGGPAPCLNVNCTSTPFGVGGC